MEFTKKMSSNDILMLDYHGPGKTILDLPDELIEHILLSLNVAEIVALSSTCRRLKDVLSRSAAIWKTLFSTNFTEISRSVERRVEKMSADDDWHNLWKNLFVQRFVAGKLVRHEVKTLSKNFYHRQDLSNVDMEHFVDIVDLLNDDEDEDEEMKDSEKIKHGKLFLSDALQSVLSDPRSDENLTDRFYARKVLRFIRCRFLTEKWTEFKNKPIVEQSYYEGLVFFSQWFQPHDTIHLSKVISDVEMIALNTLKTLLEKVPDHPIFRRAELGQPKEGSFGQYLLDRDFVLNEDIYSGKSGLQILDVLNATLFDEMGFIGNSANYYNPANSYIDQVLIRRQGIPITLCILYHLVAKRLGVLCKPVNAPRHFLLQWSNSDATTRSQEFLYVDAFNRGTRLTADEVRTQDEHSGTNINIATPIEVFQRMTRNLVTCAQIQQQETLNLQMTVFPLLKSALELTSVIGRSDEYPGFGLCQIYLQMNLNHREILQELNNWTNWPQNLWLAGDNDHLQRQMESLRRLCLSQMKENEKEREDMSLKKSKLRTDFIDAHMNSDYLNELGIYGVGMVMRHKKYNYHCVIIGWDPICKATKSWIRQMGVDRLPRKDNQPFYNVLVDDGSDRYAADENLEPVKPRRISHPLVGKYFREFHETFGYEPNGELANLYPEDFDYLMNTKRSF